jgi:hypothetical protein
MNRITTLVQHIQPHVTPSPPYPLAVIANMIAVQLAGHESMMHDGPAKADEEWLASCFASLSFSYSSLLLCYAICSAAQLSIQMSATSTTTTSTSPAAAASSSSSSSAGSDILDVVIIGGGPAAYSAALYTARFALKHILFEGTEAGTHLVTTV